MIQIYCCIFCTATEMYFLDIEEKIFSVSPVFSQHPNVRGDITGLLFATVIFKVVPLGVQTDNRVL